MVSRSTTGPPTAATTREEHDLAIRVHVANPPRHCARVPTEGQGRPQPIEGLSAGLRSLSLRRDLPHTAGEPHLPSWVVLGRGEPVVLDFLCLFVPHPSWRSSAGSEARGRRQARRTGSSTPTTSDHPCQMAWGGSAAGGIALPWRLRTELRPPTLPGMPDLAPTGTCSVQRKAVSNGGRY
jgi:hypothetical protein